MQQKEQKLQQLASQRQTQEVGGGGGGGDVEGRGRCVWGVRSLVVHAA